MKKYLLSLFSILIFSCIHSSAQQVDTLTTSSEVNGQQFWVDSVLSSLSLDEQIAQLMMISTYSN